MLAHHHMLLLLPLHHHHHRLETPHPLQHQQQEVPVSFAQVVIWKM